MANPKEIKATLKYEQDSKRYHRFRVESESGVVGTIYVPKDMDLLPERIILDKIKE